MGKLAKSIANDLKEAREASVEKESDFEIVGVEEDFEEALLEEEDEDEDEYEDFDEEDDEDFDDEDEGPTDNDLYDTIFEYPMAMGGFILNCQELLDKYPELRQHRMFLLGGVLEYQPENPASAITNTFFNYWSFFDAPMSGSAETLATIVRETALEDAEDEAIALLDRGVDSRLGFYEHCGTDEDGIRFKELGSSTEVYAIAPSAYQGEKGEIWLVRILPPLEHADCQCIVATPYILEPKHKAACEQFIKTAGAIDGTFKWSDVVTSLKHGPTPSFWPDYLKETPSQIDNDAGVILLQHPPVFPTE